MPFRKRHIASAYLPSRYRYWYSLSKLAMDPLYDAVPGAFADNRAPILDLGCGIGLLLHCLRASGNQTPYVGVDTDAEKIEAAAGFQVTSPRLLVVGDLWPRAVQLPGIDVRFDRWRRSTRQPCDPRN